MPHLLSLRHILGRINSLLSAVLVDLRRQPELEPLILSRLREVVIPVDSFSQRLPLETIILPLHNLVDIPAYSPLLPSPHDIFGPLTLLSHHPVSMLPTRQRIVHQPEMLLHLLYHTMVTPCCSLKDFLYFLICSGVDISLSAGFRHICADTPNVSFLSPA